MKMHTRIALLCITFIVGVAGARAQSTIYAGTIHGQSDLGVVFELGDPTTASPAQYLYTEYGRWISLNGGIAANGAFRFLESDPESGRTTATLEGTMDLGTGALSGTWTKAKGKTSYAFSAQRIAVFDSLKESGRAGNTGVKVHVNYPRLLPVAGLPVDALNDSIRAIVERMRNSQFEFLNDVDTTGSGNPDPDFTMAVYGELHISFINVDDGLVVLTGTNEYDGGAHPSYDEPNYNFRMTRTSVTALDPASIFLGGVDYHRNLARLIFAELKRSHFACIDNISVEGLAGDETIHSYAVTGRGLLYRLWPGAHVCGPADDIFIPWHQIRLKMLDMKGPLGHLLGRYDGN